MASLYENIKHQCLDINSIAIFRANTDPALSIESAKTSKFKVSICPFLLLDFPK